jgi:MFS family permease
MSLVIANHGFLHDLGLTGRSFDLGLLATGMLLAYGITAPLWGLVVTRIGPRAACIACLLIWPDLKLAVACRRKCPSG